MLQSLPCFLLLAGGLFSSLAGLGPVTAPCCAAETDRIHVGDMNITKQAG